MSRLQAEFDRLYAPLLVERPAPEGGADTRALVLDIGRPVDWELVAPVWRDVQADLDLPAPAIAISGSQSFQLWFSLALPIPAVQGVAFLEALRRRYLPELASARVQGFPHPAAGEGGSFVHAPTVPALVSPDQWSAFVASGLAPVFAETPWLDFPPNEEGQADLLRGLKSISAAAWSNALERLSSGPSTSGAAGAGLPTLRAPTEAATLAEAPGPAVMGAVATLAGPTGASGEGSGNRLQDPRSFLLQVMNDERVALPLRIDAAKALLPYMSEHRPAD